MAFLMMRVGCGRRKEYRGKERLGEERRGECRGEERGGEETRGEYLVE